MPNSPQQAAGMRIEPAPSDAVEAGTSAAATAVAGPPLEPPEVRCRSHGLRVIPPCAVSVNGQAASSGVRVMPMTIAPASRRAATNAASAGSGSPWAFVPRTLHSPATGVSSLTAIGTPQQGLVVAAAARPRRRVGLGQRALGEHRPECVELRVERRDPLQRGLDELARRDLAAADELGLPRDAGEGQVAALGGAGGRHGLTRVVAMSLVVVEDRGAVRHVILNRPEKRNALSAALIEELGAALRAAAADDAVRVVVLRGEGAMFSSGMDIADLGALAAEPHRLRDFRAAILATWNLCEDMAKPTIAQLHGACLGGAAELALACDLRVMARPTRSSASSRRGSA